GNIPEEVAIKRLAASSWQGSKEFLNEIMHYKASTSQSCSACWLLSSSYRNDTCLRVHAKQELRLRFLRSFNRLRIIDGISQGLVYLHSYSDRQRCIIHRDIKQHSLGRGGLIFNLRQAGCGRLPHPTPALLRPASRIK
ncbi:hypothetical protein EJB05_44785, partial [Eragrostis curvula]